MTIESSIVQDFTQRKEYKEGFMKGFPESHRESFIDYWYSRPNYGLLNENYEPVILLVDDERSNLKKFGPYSGQAEACSFAVSMFNNLRNTYLEMASNSELMVPDYLLENLEVAKGYENYDQADGAFTIYRSYY